MTLPNEDWEPITELEERSLSHLQRIRVPGGWLYRETTYRGGQILTVAMCFVPDPSGRGLT